MKCNGNCYQGRQCDCVPDYSNNDLSSLEEIREMRQAAMLIMLIWTIYMASIISLSLF